MAFTLTGVDIRIGPGLENGMVDVGDGAAIYVTTRKPSRPTDCAEGLAATTVALPLPAGNDLCVLTGERQMATLDVTDSSGSTLRFTYRVWPRTS